MLHRRLKRKKEERNRGGVRWIKLGGTAATSASLKSSRPRGQTTSRGGSTSSTPAAKAVDAAASASVVVEFETGIVEEKWLLQRVVSKWQTERATGHVKPEPVDGLLLLERDKMESERKQSEGTIGASIIPPESTIITYKIALSRSAVSYLFSLFKFRLL